MLAVVQRVTAAAVAVAGVEVAAIGAGLLVLVGAQPSDTAADAQALAAKLAGLRIFADADGKMNLSVADIDGSMLVVSQFTLLAQTAKGRRPSFVGAAPPEVAEPLVADLTEAVRQAGIPVQSGEFGAHMTVELVNDGPVTLILRSRDGRVVD